MGDTSDYVYLAFYNTMQTSDATHYLNARIAMDTNNLTLAQNELNMIADTNTINHNRITVGNIYLNTWAQDNYMLSDEQIRTLEVIAYSDPLTNGDAVYTARVMLNIDPDDYINTKSALKLPPKPQAITENTVKVYPNPTRNQITIEFRDAISSNAIIEIYGNIGNIVFKDYIQQGNYIKNIDVSKLNAGIYFYRIITNETKIATGKLIILNK